MAKNRAVAMFVDKIKVQGGSRVVDSIQASLTSSLTGNTNRLETNPNPAPASTWLENQMMDRSRMPLGTGASDDQKSTMIVLGQGSAGTQVPLGWMGRPDSWQNKAVADVSIIPFNEAMQRYQTWWSSVFRDMARIVLSAGGIEDEESLEVDVTLETLQTIDVAELVAVIDAAVTAGEKFALDPKVASNIVTAALQSALTQVGVVDAADIVAAEESQTIERVMTTVRENLRNGTITHEAAAEWAFGELAELLKEADD